MKLSLCVIVLLIFAGCAGASRGAESTYARRIYLDLVLIYETSSTGLRFFDSDGFMLCAFQRSILTWWAHFPERGFELISRSFGVDLSHVDGSRQDIVVSYGRKLKYLYYYSDGYEVHEFARGYRAHPVFEEEFVKDSVYIYVVDRVDLLTSLTANIDEIERIRAGEAHFGFPLPQADAVPEGFIELDPAIEKTGGLLQYRLSDGLILFLYSDVNRILYLQPFWDSDYFVMHENRKYIEEAKFAELLDRAMQMRAERNIENY